MRTFGVEIECILPSRISRDDTAMAITAAGVSTYDRGYTHAVDRRAWKVVRDTSLSANGQELVSPPLIVDDASAYQQIEVVCRTLKSLGAVVNKSCGLHVHIGAGDVSVQAGRRLAELYAENEGVIDSLIPPSRRGDANSYCRSVAENIDKRGLSRAASIAGIAKAIDAGDRRVKLNFNSYLKYGTVEFRHHSGTIDPVKVIAWVKLCAKLVDTAVAEAAQTAATSTSPGETYWKRGKRRRILFNMLTRPEGVTREELRQELGLTALPNIKPHLARAGAPVSGHSRERRNGHEVFRLEASAVTAAISAASPTNLTSLLDKLQFPEAERAFWTERAALMARTRPPAE